MSASIFTKGTIRACIIAVVCTAGCSRPADRNIPARRVSLAEFARPEPAAKQQHDPPAKREPPGAVNVDSPDRAADQPPVIDADNIAAGPPPPNERSGRVPLRLTQLGDRVIVDSLVGEVNGRPIFADSFLEPIEDRLLQAAEQTTGSQREAIFRTIVTSWLRDVVLESLILAEAEAALTVQQQQGLFALIRSWQEEMIRRGGGTRAGIESRLQRETGMGLDKFLGRQRDLRLVEELRRRKIEPRIIVSWRDIEREYQRRYEEFNPPPTVTLARIRLGTESQAELIEQVKQRLTRGDPFAEIAEDLGFSNGGVWDTFTMGDGGISDIDVGDEIKAALAGLGAGETSEPFTMGSATVWLHVASVDHPPARGLYDRQVQRRLGDDLRRRRSKQEWDRYVNSLFERGIYDELDQMAERLYRIALLRYGQ